MAHYAIGDIQGCFDELQRLLAEIAFQPGRDTLWLTGDIVNRGPKSLETLRFCEKYRDSIAIVLGNHDLHLLAVAYGHGTLKKHDTMAEIFHAPDAEKLLQWLRRQPLIRENAPYLMVHAGLLPEWDCAQAVSLAHEAEDALRRDNEIFLNLYGNFPDRYDENLRGTDRIRLIINVMTRMRVLNASGSLNFSFKGLYRDIPPEMTAWFDAPARRHTDKTILFGHWSALGLLQKNNTIGLDTGALWGGQLTAINLQTQETVHVQAARRYSDA